MIRFVFLFILMISLLAADGAAQENCILTAENAPVLFNLKLGSTPAQAKSVLNGKFKIKNKRKGEYTFFQNFIKDNPPPVIDGIRAFYLRFFNGKLYQIEFFYEPNERFQTLEDFVNFQTENLNLPANFWKTEYGIAEFDCTGFTIQADSALNPRIEITDEAVRAEVEAKREKK